MHGFFFILGRRKAQKGVFDREKIHPVLQREPFYTPKWAILRPEKGLLSKWNEPFWSVKRLSLQSEKALLGNEGNVKKTEVINFQQVKDFLKIRVFAAFRLFVSK